MKLLFICKYNAFRSRIAEEYFNKINKSPSIKAKSRGLIGGVESGLEQRQIAKELLGINIVNREPLQISGRDLEEADKIIVVANDVPKIIFNYRGGVLFKKIVFWKIRDEQKRNKKNIKRIILGIRNKVDELNKELERR